MSYSDTSITAARAAVCRKLPRSTLTRTSYIRIYEPPPKKTAGGGRTASRAPPLISASQGAANIPTNRLQRKQWAGGIDSHGPGSGEGGAGRWGQKEGIYARRSSWLSQAKGGEGAQQRGSTLAGQSTCVFKLVECEHVYSN